MILVLFGQPHSGKSTLANKIDAHNIDGDKLRELFANKDYSKEGRIKNLNRASDIAHYINNTGKTVVLSLVYPYKEARDYLNSLTSDVKWVYLTYTNPRGRESFHVSDFEEPELENFLQINKDNLTVEECLNQIKSYVE
jgi:gluconate kinase